MKIIREWLAKWRAKPAEVRGFMSDPPTAIVESKCPYPLSGDNGTEADCRDKKHCGCQ